MSGKLTIRKLAEELSISRSTVHRALSGHPSVRPEVRRKVLQAAQKKGYALRGPRKYRIAIIVQSFYFFGYMEYLLNALESEFHHYAFQIELITEQDLDLLGNSMFDGIVSLVWKKGLENVFEPLAKADAVRCQHTVSLFQSVICRETVSKFAPTRTIFLPEC